MPEEDNSDFQGLPGTFRFFHTWIRFTLSLRERAGVRGKGCGNFEACTNFEML